MSDTTSQQRLVRPGQDGYDRFVHAKIREWQVSGLSMAVIHGDDVFAKGYGLASIEESVPVTPETLFYGASTTKAFVAAALAILVYDDEKYPAVKWTTPVHELVGEDFTLQDKPYWTQQTTIEDALCHRTGLTNWDFSYPDKHATIQDVVRSIRHLPLTREPRTTFQYCNFMYTTAGYVVEKVTGMTLAEFLKTHIWDPLGMHSTYFSLQDATDGSRGNVRLAVPYILEDGQFQEIDPMVIPQCGGAGCIISNVLDYSKWLRCMLNKTGPIPAKAFDELIKPRIFAEGRMPPQVSDAYYCLGWQITYYQGVKIAFHEGSLEGFGCKTIFIPSRSWAVATFGNTQNVSNYAEHVLTWHLIDELLGVPSSDRLDWDVYYREKMRTEKSISDNAYMRLYPHIDPVIPHSRPLDQYAGPWYHPAFGTLKFKLTDNGKSLWCYKAQVMWKHHIRLRHVTGEHFIANMWGVGRADVPYVTKAEFHVAADGEPDVLHLQYQNRTTADAVSFVRQY